MSHAESLTFERFVLVAKPPLAFEKTVGSCGSAACAIPIVALAAPISGAPLVAHAL